MIHQLVHLEVKCPRHGNQQVEVRARKTHLNAVQCGFVHVGEVSQFLERKATRFSDSPQVSPESLDATWVFHRGKVTRC